MNEENKKLSAKEEIIESFGSISSFTQWNNNFVKYWEWKPDIIKNKWFIEVIFSLPAWQNIHDYNFAIEVLIMANKSLVDDKWFETDIFEKYKPSRDKNDDHKNEALQNKTNDITKANLKPSNTSIKKDISNDMKEVKKEEIKSPPQIKRPVKCKSCNKEIFFLMTKLGKTIPVDTELQSKNDNNLDAMVINDAGVVGKIKELNEGYFVHFYTCPDAKIWRKNEPKKETDKTPIKEFIPVLDTDRIPM